MRKLKDSGIPWIGEIPENWEQCRMKWVATLTPPVDISTIDEDKEITFLPMEFVKQGFYVPNAAPVGKISSSYSLFAEGDIVMAKVTPCFENGNIARADGLLNRVGFGSSELFVLRSKGNVYRNFLFWLLQAEPFRSKAIESMSGAGGLKRVSSEDVENYALFLPPLPEQRQIADYLDGKCARIDETIEKQKLVIEKLKAYKQSVITEAVTKGLDPNAPMKDSGIEWIGKIPKQWQVKKVCWMFDVVLGKMLDTKKITGKNLVSYLRNTDVQWGAINFCDLNQMDFSEADIGKYSVAIGDLLVCEGGEIGRSAIVTTLPDETICFQKALHRIRVKDPKENSVKFFYYVLFAMAKNQAFSDSPEKATIAHLPAVILKLLRIPSPALNEQRQIADYLDRKCADIDTAIAKKEALIEKLADYKKSLIYECVTGKREV
jgi:type I restriction enzyme S subunit